MNILTEIKLGREGKNKGLNIGHPKLNSAIGGLQKKTSVAIGGEKKHGKTQFADDMFVLSIFLLNPLAKVKWIYYSFEIDRISKEAKYIAFFLKYDYDIEVSDKYVLGQQVDDNNDLVEVTDDHMQKIEIIYQKYIIPLFGEYDDMGNRIKEGKIDFIEERTNPTGIRNYLINYAKQNGQLVYEDYETEENNVKVKRKRLIGYKENDEELCTIVIIDHVRALSRERGFNMKENIDKISEYHVFLRNMFKFSFIIISHLNRSSADIERLKYMGDKIFPSSEQFKDKIPESL